MPDCMESTSSVTIGTMYGSSIAPISSENAIGTGICSQIDHSQPKRDLTAYR